MVECPVCGSEGPEGRAGCEVCGLPIGFFESVREASTAQANVPAAPSTPEPSSAKEDPTPGPPEPRSTPPPPSLPGRPRRTEPPPSKPKLLEPEIETPIAGDGSPELEALRVGISLGLDLSEFDALVHPGGAANGTAKVARLRRDLVSTVLEGLLEHYRRICERRDVLSTVMRTQPLDLQLTSYRRALGKGELAEADAQRLKAQGAVQTLEESLNRIRARFTEAGLMMRALQELGGVAPMALRPVAAAIKVPRRAEAGQIERHLNRTNSLLWGLLAPRMNHEIAKCRSLLTQTRASTARTNLIRYEMERMAEEIRAQKISEALASRRVLHAEMASIAPPTARQSRARFNIDQVHQS